MTALTPASGPAAAPGPCLTDAPPAGLLITLLFATAIVLFLAALATFAA